MMKKSSAGNLESVFKISSHTFLKLFVLLLFCDISMIIRNAREVHLIDCIENSFTTNSYQNKTIDGLPIQPIGVTAIILIKGRKREIFLKQTISIKSLQIEPKSKKLVRLELRNQD